MPGVRVSHIFICEARSGRLLPRTPGPAPKRGYCEQKDDGGIAVAEPGDTPVLLNDVAIGKLGIDGFVAVAEHKLDLSKKEFPRRAIKLFALSTWTPMDSMFRQQQRPDRYECEFECMWGYALPCRSFGFFDAMPYRTALSSSYAWIGETRAGLIFNVAPSQEKYQLTIEILGVVSPPYRLQVFLNGTKLIDNSQNAPRLEATFASHLLRSENNILELVSELDDKLGLSFAVKRISIRPTNQ